MAGINTSKSPSNRAVLPYYISGAILFLLLSQLLLWNAEVLHGHYFSPKLLAMVHLAALGWGTMVIFGAGHQLLPVIAERKLFNENLAVLTWFLLLAGIGLLVCGFWTFHSGKLLISGGVLVVLASVGFSINVFGTAYNQSKKSPQKLFLLFSSLWLLITVIAGLLLAINLFYPYIERNHLEFLKLHAHAGLAGWFLMLITGVSTKLVPMFLLAKSERNELLFASLILQNLGLLLFVLDGLFFSPHLRLYLYYLLILVGIVLWILYLFDAYKNRLRKRIELLMKQTMLSFLSLILALFVVPILILSTEPKHAITYGILLFLGWISGIILGKTFKTLPFIVWNTRFASRSGKEKVPLPSTLYSLKLVRIQTLLYCLSLPLLIVGVSFHWISLTTLSLALWNLMALLYLINLYKVLRPLFNLK